MTTVNLTALTGHGYGGKRRQPGDTYEADAKIASMLVKAGVSTYTNGPPVETRTAPTARPKRKRVYKRRDMRAED